MNKTQKQTIEILTQLVEKQKSALAERDNVIFSLSGRKAKEGEEQPECNITDADTEELHEKIECLEGKVEEECCQEFIQCGIGVIGYRTDGSIQLMQIMESFESAIKKQGTVFMEQVLDLLSK